MQLLLKDIELNIKDKNYLFYYLNSNNIKNSIEDINEYLNDVDNIILLFPFVNMCLFYDIAQTFYNAKIYNVYKAMHDESNITNIELIWKEKPILKYLELEITSECNLKCKGCSHFSYLDNYNYCIENYTKDIECLSQKYSNITVIRLLGGEPLLSKELIEFLLITRKYFPYSDVHIATNGILINKIPDDLLNIIHDLKINIDVSLYPQLFNLKEPINEWAIKNNIGCTIYNAFVFSRYLSVKESTSDHITYYDHCNCHTLKDGKISRCPFPLNIYRLNNRFGTAYPTNDYIDIYSSATAWEINKYLSLKTNMCSYCLEKPREFACRQIKDIDNISLNDWVKS